MKSLSRSKFIILVLFLHIVSDICIIYLATNNLLKFAIVLFILFTVFIGIFMKQSISRIH